MKLHLHALGVQAVIEYQGKSPLNGTVPQLESIRHLRVYALFLLKVQQYLIFSEIGALSAFCFVFKLVNSVSDKGPGVVVIIDDFVIPDNNIKINYSRAEFWKRAISA